MTLTILELSGKSTVMHTFYYLVNSKLSLNSSPWNQFTAFSSKATEAVVAAFSEGTKHSWRQLKKPTDWAGAEHAHHFPFHINNFIYYPQI